MQLLIVIAATCLGAGSCPQGPGFDGGYAAGDADAVRVIRASEVGTGVVDRDSLPPPLTRIPGTPAPVVSACRASVDEAARSLDPVRVDAVSAGEAVRGPDGILRAPLEIQIIYSHGGERELRQSRIECHLDGDGRLVSLKGLGDGPDDASSEVAQAEPDDRQSEPDDRVVATGSLPSSRIGGVEVVAAFYDALGAGDGGAASQYVVPEKQMEGPLSAREISGYFGNLARPLRTERILQVGADEFEVRYTYGIGSRYCAGSALVTLTSRDELTFIESIRASEDCS